jgi:hypothetical protein
MIGRAYIGIDNGVTGSLAFIGETPESILFTPTFTIKQQNYTKRKQNINRIDFIKLRAWISCCIGLVSRKENIRVFMERPFTFPGKMMATFSALRCLESTLVIIEDAELSYEYVDSRRWQRIMLPVGIKGSKELKIASLNVGLRLFPSFTNEIKNHGDADSLLIAEWARREGL